MVAEPLTIQFQIPFFVFMFLLFSVLPISVKLFIQLPPSYVSPSLQDMLAGLALDSLVPLRLNAAFEMLAVA